MTREEAKEVFINRGYVNVKGGTIFDGDKWRQSVEVITEWLKEQPCEEAISRQAVIDAIAANCIWENEYQSRMKKAVEKLPLVKPQEPFMNKPCVSHQVCHEDKVKVLDKIKAKIAKRTIEQGFHADEWSISYNELMKIIDKYKTESKG